MAMAITPAGSIALALCIIALFSLLCYYFLIFHVYRHGLIQILEQRNADAAAEEREVEEAEDSVEGAGEPETRDTSAGTR